MIPSVDYAVQRVWHAGRIPAKPRFKNIVGLRHRRHAPVPAQKSALMRVLSERLDLRFQLV